MSSAAQCRLCDAALTRTFVDLGMSPLCESYVPAARLEAAEVFYPLHVRICEDCLLVQLPAYVPGEEIFSEYAYFSSYSDSWVAHAKRYADAMIGRLGLTGTSLVTEVASNDGYLLQHFLAAGVGVLGIEPAGNVARVAQDKGIETEVEFLGRDTGPKIAERHGTANLVVANNVFAHVPDIRGFAAGLRALVKDDGLVTLEFPHLYRLIAGRQYDTIYHEHFSYLSLLTATRALADAGLAVVDVDELGTHGGSLRVYAVPLAVLARGATPGTPADNAVRSAARIPAPSGGRSTPGTPADNAVGSAAVKAVLDAERSAGLHSLAGHEGFAGAVATIKSDLLGFLLDAAKHGRTVAGYGAPGKGNTLLNHCGIRSDLLSYTVDRNPRKQGLFLPGTHIPIHAPDRLAQTRPDYILVLPWNLREELIGQLAYVRGWGGRLVFPIPALEIV